MIFKAVLWERSCVTALTKQLTIGYILKFIHPPPRVLASKVLKSLNNKKMLLLDSC